MKIRRTILVSLVCCLSLAGGVFTQTSAAEGNRYALLIGVNDYQHLRQLRFCENDMRALHGAFLGAGFEERHLTLMLNTQPDHLQPIRANIQQQMEVLLRGVQPEDLVVVAFSGHGVHIQDAEGAGQDYLCTRESQLGKPETMLPVDIVSNLLDRCRARRKMIIVDACRDNPLPHSTKGVQYDPTKEGERSLGGVSGLRSVADPNNDGEGFVELRSCGEKEVSVEDENLGRGVFMNFVVRGLSGEADYDHDQNVDAMELYMYARSNTWNHVHKTRSILQLPTFNTPNDSELAGKLVLASTAARPVQPVAHREPKPSPKLEPMTRPSSARPSLDTVYFEDADKSLREGNAQTAIARFEQLLATGTDPDVLDQARIRLAYAYLKDDLLVNVERALQLRKQAGKDTVRLYILRDNVPMKSGDQVRRHLRKRQIVGIDKVVDGWYHVVSINDDPLEPQRTGYVYKTAFQEAKATSANTGTPSTNSSSGGGNGGWGHGWGGGWGHGWGGWGGW